jgi:four helix bundle protein
MNPVNLKDFRNFQIWDNARRLTLQLHWISSKFPESDPDGLGEKIKVTCLSLWANIADGCSNKQLDEAIQCIDISNKMSAKLELLLRKSKDMNYLKREDYDELSETLIGIRKKLTSLLEKLSGEKQNLKQN